MWWRVRVEDGRAKGILDFWCSGGRAGRSVGGEWRRREPEGEGEAAACGGVDSEARGSSGYVEGRRVATDGWLRDCCRAPWPSESVFYNSAFQLAACADMRRLPRPL